MKPLEINQFKGEETVKKNKKLTANAAFYSKFKSFEGKLSSSHYVVKFPVKGEETYFTLNKTIKVNSSSYLITNPNIELEGFANSKTEIIGVCVGFTNTYLNDLALSIGQKMSLSLDNPFINSNYNIDFFTKKNRIKNDEFGNTLQIIKQYLLNDKISEVYEEEQFYLAFGEVLLKNELNIHSKISNLPNTRMSTREEIYRRVDIMDQFIHDNFTESITLEELSQVACLSKHHAVRCYQKIEGVSPYKKIIALRLQKAIELLNQGFKVSEVSDLCGFTDYRAFSKLFKKQLGLIPSQYSRKCAS